MYKVILGSVLTDNGEVKTGSFIELSDKDAKLLLNEKVIEEVVKEKKEESKPKKEIKEKKVEAKKKESVNVVDEPSLDWTRSELEERAILLGIKKPEKLGNKKALLKAILERGELK
jgi:hypothetical protein